MRFLRAPEVLQHSDFLLVDQHDKNWYVALDIERHASNRSMAELPADGLRLLLVLNEAGGRAELCTNPCQDTPSDYLGPSHISLLPQGTRAWHQLERMGYCRYLLIHFDEEQRSPGNIQYPQFAPRLMFSDSTIWRYGQLIAQELAQPDEWSGYYGESISLTLFLALVRLNAEPALETIMTEWRPGS